MRKLSIFLVLVFASSSWGVDSGFNVVNFGAVGDGKTDDTQAFLRAWTAVCTAGGFVSLDVPAGRTFLVNSMNFSGPCKSSAIHFWVAGNLVAPSSQGAWTKKSSWLSFARVDKLTITGPGQIDGQGSIWWTCPILLIWQCNYFTLTGLNIVNGAEKHVVIIACNRVTVSSLKITAPERSPNTDGIHIQEVQHVQIQDCNIGTGDDCVSIGQQSRDVNVTRITCGPGHGVSIGSLGQGNSQAIVEGIHVDHIQFIRTLYGARIKTWQGGSGYVKNVVFENLNFTAAYYPIIIDQYYCFPLNSCKNQSSAVQISDVKYIGLTGSSANERAINLACSESMGCTNIHMESISLTSAAPGKPATAYCLNAHGSKSGTVVPPVPCLA